MSFLSVDERHGHTPIPPCRLYEEIIIIRIFINLKVFNSNTRRNVPNRGRFPIPTFYNRGATDLQLNRGMTAYT